MHVVVPTPELTDAVIERLVGTLRRRRFVAVTGAGMSTESGIPDYRGATTGRAPTRPIQHRDFVDRESVRRRYWTRSLVGHQRFVDAAPNEAHRALARLERVDACVATITQNVDGLHQRAGTTRVVELHGNLGRVRCLDCGDVVERSQHQARLRDANPDVEARTAAMLADGDADVPDEVVDAFVVPPCSRCAGRLMPDVVFFGGDVPIDVRDRAFAHVDEASAMLVLGTSLAVFSGLRYVRRAHERGIPIVRIGLGSTRGDALADACIEARLGDALPRIAERFLSDDCRRDS